jgi:hypothetical protein
VKGVHWEMMGNSEALQESWRRWLRSGQKLAVLEGGESDFPGGEST